jgi:pimeloyl-ACP methyl ester carboxylesterase
MRPFVIRIIIEGVVALIVCFLFLGIHISRRTLPRWEPRLPEAPTFLVHTPGELDEQEQDDEQQEDEEWQWEGELDWEVVGGSTRAGDARAGDSRARQTTDDDDDDSEANDEDEENSDEANDVSDSKEVAAAEYPVLMIHGFASSTRVFDYHHCVRPLLEEGHDVFLTEYRPREDGPKVPMTRVFIHSLLACLPRSALPVSIETMAADLVVLINERGWEKVHVVGHSMGGMVAQALAIEVPEKIASLTTVGSCVGPGLGPCVPSVGRLLMDAVKVMLPRLREKLIGGEIVCTAGKKQARTEWGHRQMAAIITSRGRARKLDALVRRGRLRGAMIAVSGEKDSRVAPLSAPAAGRRITGCKSVVIGGMGHSPKGEEWTEVLRLAGLVRSKTKERTETEYKQT